MGIIMALLIIVYIFDKLRQHSENYNEAQRIKKLKKLREYEKFIASERQRHVVQEEDDSAYAHLFAPSNKKGRK